MKKYVLILCLNVVTLTTQAGGFPEEPPAFFNPLNLSVRMTLPFETTTVAQAVMFVLKPTGYKVAVGKPASSSAADILMQPVPPDAFNERVMTVLEALLLLIGDNNRLLVDPRHCLVSFESVSDNERSEA